MPSTSGPTRHQTTTVFSTAAGGPPRAGNPFTPGIKAADDDEIELTPAQVLSCWLAVKAVAAAGTTVIDAALLDEIETKALAGEQLAGVDPARARRRRLVAYFGTPA